MATFALLLNNAPDRFKGESEDDYLAIIKEYVAWVEGLSADGVYKGGQKLTDERGVTLKPGTGGVEVHESPFAEMSEILGGVMLIEAADYDAAVAIAKTCPHLGFGQSLEIREVDHMD